MGESSKWSLRLKGLAPTGKGVTQLTQCFGNEFRTGKSLQT